MYAIYRKKASHGSHRASKRDFATYDEARNYARQLIRKSTAYKTIGANYRNPCLSDYGFFVKQVRC